jgi:hypothetical protein
VLAGYLDEETLSRIRKLERSVSERPIDIGYRAWRAEPWLGQHGMLKTYIADLFQQKASAWGLVTDISTREEDTLPGDKWYEFLFKCKYTIGVEGGASLLDRDGTIKQKTNSYMASHPLASFEEIEAACFPRQDGSFHLMGISPRHLEACATRTCQVLVEGDYNGILLAGRHYIELKRNFNNLDQVLDLIKEDRLRETLTNQAYKDIVESGRYNSRSFVQQVLTEIFGETFRLTKPSLSFGDVLFRSWARWADWFSWRVVAFYTLFLLPLRRQLRRVLVQLFSEERVQSAIRWFRNVRKY